MSASNEVEIELSEAEGLVLGAGQLSSNIWGKLTSLAPGVLAAAAISALSTPLGGLAPVIGAPVIAIVTGLVVSGVWQVPSRLGAGLAFSSKRVLQGAIVILGAGLSLGQVVSTGAKSLPVLLGTLVIALAMAWLAGRVLRLPRDLNTLIGVGTAICGASAIAATDAVIDAEEADVSYAIATIFVFNVVAVLTYPSLGHLLGLSQHSFGLWAGTAINDLSSVVAASTIYGHSAASYAVVVKLTRTLAIVPISVALAALRSQRQGFTKRASGDKLAALGRTVPLFILFFIGAVVLNTVGLVPSTWHQGLADLSTWMITAALAAIGLSADFSHIRRAGLRPIALGAALWATVGLTSLALQAVSGSL